MTKTLPEDKDKTWPEYKDTIIPLYLKARGLVRQHIESFDYFIQKDIQKIVSSNHIVDSDIDPSFYLKYTNIYIGYPTITENCEDKPITPHDCRIRDLTYSAPIYVDIEYTRGKQIVTTKGVKIGRMPIMLRSSHCHLTNPKSFRFSPGVDHITRMKECPLDPGGYFICRGSEKVVLIQEQLSNNRILVDTDRRGLLFASVTSSTHERKSKTSVIIKRDRFYVKHNSLTEDIPLAIMMRALGITSDRELCLLICGSEDGAYVDLLFPSLEDPIPKTSNRSAPSPCVLTELQALQYIGNRVRLHRKQFQPVPRPSYLQTDTASPQAPNPSFTKKDPIEDAREFLVDILLSHIQPLVTGNNLYSTYCCLKPKALYLAFMTRRILQAKCKDTPVDDRDYVGNKRFELAGGLLSILFEDLFKRHNEELKKSIDKILSKSNRAQEFDVARLLSLQGDFISAGLLRCLITGNWFLRRFRMERSGITQSLSRLSYLSAIGMMTRIHSQFEKTRKISGPRSLQTSQWGMLCPSDTPEGEACGLVKNMSLLAHITTHQEELPIVKICVMLGMNDILHLSGSAIYSSVLVLINGNIAGAVMPSHAPAFVQSFRILRRTGHMPHSISISMTLNTIQISTDGGRICRPLILLHPTTGTALLDQSHLNGIKNGTMTLDDCLKEGRIEYLDVPEESNALIAMYPRDIEPGKTTHLEIDPCAILGAVASLIPFPHHNQSPRNTYQCAMGKQAMGVIGYNQMERLDSLLYLLVYPQKPLVMTKPSKFINCDKLPAGQNGILAVTSYSGYDIEDALILNKASLDRGFGRCMVLKKVSSVIKKYPNQTKDKLVPPNSDIWKQQAMDKDGIARLGERLLPGQVFINRHVPVAQTAPNLEGNQAPAPDFKYAGSTYRGPGVSYVDRVALTTNGEDQMIVKVQLRSTRRPEVGDKFSSRHGQKGVCGLIVPQEDMPFTENGICPDIIMNPHGFPSRMTVGKMLELISGKTGVLKGEIMDGTAFSSCPVEELCDTLVKHGYNACGKDIMMCGTSGEIMEAYIFTGPIYYQKLKHMVLDKMHARARGPRAVLTRQPMEGRSRDGGLRLGEMERDCLIGYGSAMLLKERLMISSDAYSVDVCQSCGLLGYSGWCNLCKTSKEVVKLTIPYACKLLFQELQSMNIAPRLRLESEI